MKKTISLLLTLLLLLSLLPAAAWAAGAAPQTGSDADDNISVYDVYDVGADTARFVIHSLCALDQKMDQPVNLGVEWRNDYRDIRTVGLTKPAMQQLAAAGRSACLRWHGTALELSASVLTDMAGRLGDQELLWVTRDYGERDGRDGKAEAFRFRVTLGDRAYALPAGERYGLTLHTEGVDGTVYELFCPTAQNDQLVKENVTVTSHIPPTDPLLEHSFSVDHDGMFVLMPQGYTIQNPWPWHGAGPVIWSPGAGTVPANAPGHLAALYAQGYTLPAVGPDGDPRADLHLVFPDELKEWTDGCGDDWDYKWYMDTDTGILTVEVNGAARDRWETAVREQTVAGNLMGGVYFRYYFGASDSGRPMTYGYSQYNDFRYDENGNADTDLTGTWPLLTDYESTNGLQLGSVNRQSASSSTLTIDGSGAQWLCALAMDDESGKNTDNAAVRYALQINIRPVRTYSYTVEANNGVPADKVRIHVQLSAEMTPYWQAVIPEDGIVFLRYRDGAVDFRSGRTEKDGTIARLTVDAPAGYRLVRWQNWYENLADTSFPALIRYPYDQPILIEWENAATGERLLERVGVECGNAQEWMWLLGDGTVPVTPQKFAVDSAAQKKLADNGIYLDYDSDIGYFTASADASRLTDVSLLTDAGITLVSPFENAAYCRISGFGGSENPACHGRERAEDYVARFSGEGMMPVSELENFRALPCLAVQALQIANVDMTVFYSDFQLYRGVAVQWLDENGTVIGYSFIYGRNGDFITEVNTQCVSSAPTEAVDRPTLVGEDMGFTCDINPQSGAEDGHTRFLRMDVEDPSRIGEDGVAIYLPYSYFNLTVKDGLALAQQGKQPTIYHYTDESCTEYETITGEYTAQGVRFVTTGFSPFVVVCEGAGGSSGGDNSGGHGAGGNASGTAAAASAVSPETFDGGIALYLGTALTSAAGAAWLTRRKKER